MLAAIGLAVAAITASIFVHYEILRFVSSLMPSLKLPPRSRLIGVIGGVIIAHLAEIIIFASVYFYMDFHPLLGQLDGHADGNLLDFFYFSAATYTTLGMGDLFPRGPMRLVVGIESLAGLILIGWSTSFTYLAMREFWGLHKPRRRR